MLFISLIVQAYVRFTCNATNGTVTVEEDCDTAICDSCKNRRERLAVPACFMVQHGGETESVTVNCANGKAVVNVYTFMPGAQAKCPIGTGARLEDADVHVSGQCEVDSHGHHEHEDIDDHGDHHDDDHDDDHDDHAGKDIIDMVKHMIDVLVSDARHEHVVGCALCDVCDHVKVHCMV